MSAYRILSPVCTRPRMIRSAALAILAISSASAHPADCSTAMGDAAMHQYVLIERIQKCLPESIDSPACQDAMIMIQFVEQKDLFRKYELCADAGLAPTYEEYSSNMTKIAALKELFVQKITENPELLVKMLHGAVEKLKEMK